MRPLLSHVSEASDTSPSGLALLATHGRESNLDPQLGPQRRIVAVGERKTVYYPGDAFSIELGERDV